MIDIAIKHYMHLGDNSFHLDIELNVPTKNVTALFGPSGAGKTTLINVIAGLLRPDSARIVIDRTVLNDTEKRIFEPPNTRRIGYVFQDGRLFPHLSVSGNLGFGQRFSSPVAGSDKITFGRVSELLRLDPLLNRPIQGLSGGERQRVAIGRALLANPRLLLMDEPLASLDVERKAEILPFLEEIGQLFGIPIIYVSHSLPEIRRLAKWIAVMDGGKISAFGPVEQITSRIDLAPLTEAPGGGSVLSGYVIRHDEKLFLTYLECEHQRLIVPMINADVGAPVRVQVRPEDIAISLAKPNGLSVLNVLAGHIENMRDIENSPSVDVLLNVGDQDITAPLWAKVTKLAVKRLALKKGMMVYALIKSVSIDRTQIGIG